MLPRLFLSLLFTCVLAWQALGLTPGQRVVLFGHPFVGVIDQLGVAPAADYSSRCLTRNWLGKHVVNIRRASDNATTDLNCLAPSGNLDSSTFNTFCAATTCFVAKWYDQSGNGNDALQATAANQPQLVLNSQNGHPGLSVSGSQWLQTGSTLFGSSLSGLTALTVASWANFTNFPRAISTGTGIFKIQTEGASSGIATDVNNVFANSGALATGPYIVGSRWDGANVTNRLNGAANGGPAGLAAPVAASAASLSIAAEPGGSSPLTGNVYEHILFLSDIGLSKLQAAEANANAYWHVY